MDRFNTRSLLRQRPVGPASFVSSTTQRPGRSILVGRQRESSTSYLLDGVALRNPRVPDASINSSSDSIDADCGGSFGTPNQIQDAQAARMIQLGLRLQFCVKWLP